MFGLSVFAQEAAPTASESAEKSKPRSSRRSGGGGYKDNFIAYKGILESAEPYHPLSPKSRFYDAPSEEAFRLGEHYYQKFIGKVAPTNVPFADVYRGPFRVPRGNIDIRDSLYGKNKIWIRGQEVWMTANTNQLLSFSNKVLSRYIRTNDTQTVPALSLEQAYAQALRYLDIFGVKIDSRAALAKLYWGSETPPPEGIAAIWYVVWVPTDGGYPYDEFVKDFYNPCIGICFSEKYGLVSFTNALFPPPPKTTEVRIPREAAIFKAEKAVPLVMLTPYYRQCRMPGFKVSGVKSAELRIAYPNWMLDPARAIWPWDGPPKETRLCWIVRFITVDTVEREKGIKLFPPDVLIYVDAATGEIVGADFT
jgi:hypothetical protein